MKRLKIDTDSPDSIILNDNNSENIDETLELNNLRKNK